MGKSIRNKERRLSHEGAKVVSNYQEVEGGEGRGAGGTVKLSTVIKTALDVPVPRC